MEKYYIITVTVDTDKLKATREENGGKGESIEEMINIEMGWVADSGIYIDTIEEKKL